MTAGSSIDADGVQRREGRWWVEHFGLIGLRPQFGRGRPAGEPVTLEEFIATLQHCGAWQQLSETERNRVVTAQRRRSEPPLVWARWRFRGCRAHLEPGPAGPYWGRCDLAPHGPEVDHALERGMDVVRWRTLVTG